MSARLNKIEQCCAAHYSSVLLLWCCPTAGKFACANQINRWQLEYLFFRKCIHMTKVWRFFMATPYVFMVKNFFSAMENMFIFHMQELFNRNLTSHNNLYSGWFWSPSKHQLCKLTTDQKRVFVSFSGKEEPWNQETVQIILNRQCNGFGDDKDLW